MTTEEFMDIIFDLVSDYFSTARVMWGSTAAVRPGDPLVTLQMGDVVRTFQPISIIRGGVPMDCYPSNTVVQVDLFTTGRKLNDTPGVTSSNLNTAVSDLTAFLNYIGSQAVTDWCDKHDVAIATNMVRNLTGVVSDTSWDYRAMTELEISFTQTAVGHAGVMFDNGVPFHSSGSPMFDEEGYTLDREGVRVRDEDGELLPPLPIDPVTGRPDFPKLIPSPSGGGSQTLAEQSEGWFEQVEINKEEN